MWRTHRSAAERYHLAADRRRYGERLAQARPCAPVHGGVKRQREIWAASVAEVQREEELYRPSVELWDSNAVATLGKPDGVGHSSVERDSSGDGRCRRAVFGPVLCAFESAVCIIELGVLGVGSLGL
jgi:hypothetical protein